MFSFIVASLNAQSVKDNDIACRRCEISTFIKDDGVDLFFLTETWPSAQGEEAKSFKLEPSVFDVKTFPRQSQARGGGIATIYKYTLVQALITMQHYIFSVCTALNQTDKTILLTLCLLISCQTFFITYATSPDLFILLVI